MKPRVLLLEDDEIRGQRLSAGLASVCECRLVGTVEQARSSLLQGRWAALVVNYEPACGSSGLEVLQMARETLPHAFRLLYNEVRSASFRCDAERLLDPHFVGHASDAAFDETLREAIEHLFAAAPADAGRDLPPAVRESLVACAPASRRFAQALCAAGAEDGPVYIYGEPGTGVSRAGALLRQMRREHRATTAPHPGGRGPVRVLRMPPLRERPQDVAVLADQRLLEESRQTGGLVHRLSPRAREELLARDWFGNVRELEATVARAIQRAGARAVIEAEDLPRDSQPGWRPSQFAKDAGQRDCVLRQLRMAHNVSAAARLEGCSRANYIRLMRRLGIIRADLTVESRAPVATGHE